MSHLCTLQNLLLQKILLKLTKTMMSCTLVNYPKRRSIKSIKKMQNMFEWLLFHIETNILIEKLHKIKIFIKRICFLFMFSIFK